MAAPLVPHVAVSGPCGYKPASRTSEPESFSAQLRACLIWGLKPGDTRKELYAIYKTECLESSAMPQQMFGDTQGAMSEAWCQIQWPPCFGWELERHTTLSILLSMKPTFESITGSRASWACGSVKPSRVTDGNIFLE